MPNLAFPFDNQPWPAERFYRDSMLWAPSAVVADAVPAGYGSGPLGLSFAVAGSVITVSMSTGRARVGGGLFERTETSWTSGMPGDQPHEGSAAYPLNSNSQPRVDRLVLRRDLAAGKIYPVILLGTPATNPAAPEISKSPTGFWDLPLHQWRLAGGSSTAISNTVDERKFVDPEGVPFDDTGWVTVPTKTGYGNNQAGLQLRRIGKRVQARHGWNSTGLTLGGNHVVATVPAGFVPPGGMYDWAGTNNVANTCRVVIDGVTGDVTLSPGGAAVSSYYRLDNWSWLTD